MGFSRSSEEEKGAAHWECQAGGSGRMGGRPAWVPSLPPMPA